MAELILGIGTSHSPMLSIPSRLWSLYAQNDLRNKALTYPPNGWTMSYDEGLAYVGEPTRGKLQSQADFDAAFARCRTALSALSRTLIAADPDITIIVSDDQDEWFYENNMPMFGVYWGESARLIPRQPSGDSPDQLEMQTAIATGYGDHEMEVPVAARFGRFLVESLCEQDFDLSHSTYASELSGGRVARRYPTQTGELDLVQTTAPKPQGLPHGFAFVVKNLFNNQPKPIVPVFVNTCYPPNQPSPRRCFALGGALRNAVAAWPEPARVAVVASGGLSHFVVDEDFDRRLLDGLAQKDAAALQTLPRERLYSATSESLNWVVLGGAMQQTNLPMHLIDYVPVYRTPAGTGGGWAFATWQPA